MRSELMHPELWRDLVLFLESIARGELPTPQSGAALLRRLREAGYVARPRPNP